jgi:hypothetical protein
MNNIVLIFASKKEAGSLLYQSAFKFIKTDNYFISRETGNNICVFICGIGQKKVNIFLENTVFPETSFFYKPGTCAVLNENISTLKPIIPGLLCFEKNQITVDEKNIPPKLRVFYDKNLRLKTSITPVLNSEKTYDLADMETYFLAEKIKVIPLLVGTDRGNFEAEKDFIENLNKASIILKDTILLLV